MESKKKDFPDFQVPVSPLSPEQQAQSERLLKRLRAREQAEKERAALKEKDLH